MKAKTCLAISSIGISFGSVAHMSRSDYREKVQFDQYEYESADEEEYQELDRDARLVAEAKMRRRDRDLGLVPAAFLEDGTNLDPFSHYI